MKNFLFPLLLFPLITQAQLIEMSASTGYVFNDLLPRNDPYSYHTDMKGNRHALAMALSGTMKLPYNFRLGLSAAIYRFGYSLSSSGTSYYSYRIYSDPVLVELSLLSRNKFGRYKLDLGVSGGIATHKRTMKILRKGIGSDMKTLYTNPWYTYGFTASVSRDITDRVALGIEVQPKAFVSDLKTRQKSSFIFPAFVKATVRI